jgi:aminoacrylate hydrolase
MPFAPITHGELYYETAGTGPPLLLITGLGGLGSFWRNQVEPFRERFTVITFDQRGTGRSTRTLAPYSIEQMAADTLALLDHLGHAQPALVGHSTGGAIGLCLAATRPERVQRLVLSATWTHADGYFRRLFEARRDLLERGAGELYQRLSTLMLLPPEWIARNEAAVAEREAQAPASQLERDILMRRIDALLRHDGREWARKVACPALVIAAQDDAVTPAYFSHALAQLVPGAALTLLEKGGHLVPQTEALAYNARLAEFLQTNADPIPTLPSP